MEQVKHGQRQSNIELLRCLLMFMVVTLHYNNAQMGGAFAGAEGINMRILQLLEAFSICAVDCFVLISAYFLSATQKRNIWKPVNLLLMSIGYKLVCYIVTVYLGLEGLTASGLLVCFLPNNWFVVLFCVMYMISAYINPLFDHLGKKQLENLIVISLIMFSVYPTIVEGAADYFHLEAILDGMGTVTKEGSGSGYTIVNFLMLYLIGGYLRKYPPKPGKIRYLLLFLVLTACDFVLAWFSGTYTSYANILVILQAVMLFLAFLNLDMGHNSVINMISKSAFGIYLIHTCGLFVRHFWARFHIPEYASGTPGKLLLNAFISVTAMYLCCLVVDLGRRSLVWVFRKIFVKIKRRAA